MAHVASKGMRHSARTHRAQFTIGAFSDHRCRDTPNAFEGTSQAPPMPEYDVVKLILAITEKLPDVIESLRKDAWAAGLQHALIDRLAERLTERARHCRKQFDIAAA